jgi:hypothetical protein
VGWTLGAPLFLRLGWGAILTLLIPDQERAPSESQTIYIKILLRLMPVFMAGSSDCNPDPKK